MAEAKYKEWLLPENLLRIQGEYVVYMHIFPNGKKYIGITCQGVNKRWRSNGSGYKTQGRLYNAILKYGWENIEHLIIEKNISKECAEKLEVELIKLNETTNKKMGYNTENGGMTQGKFTDEIRKKISDNRKGKLVGKDNGFYGKKHSKETIKKLKEIAKNRIVSEETKLKISVAGKKPIIQLNLNGEFIKKWDSAKDAADFLQIKSGTSITACCKKQRGTAYKYKWKYCKEVE